MPGLRKRAYPRFERGARTLHSQWDVSAAMFQRMKSRVDAGIAY
jgi:hypothetical protein